MKYITLFNLEIMHGYYADERCADFQIEPTPETQKLLNACRCALKPLFHGLRMPIAVNEKNRPFVALPENPIFAFQLRLRHSNFDKFTDLTAIRQTEAPLFTNEKPATGGNLALVSQKARNNEQLTVRQPAAGEAFCLGGRPLENLKPADFSVIGLGKKAGIKNHEAGSRVVTLDTSAVGAGTPFTVDYPVTSQLPPGVFAAVEIKYDSTPVPFLEDNRVFQIVFRPKEARWKYYIVTDPTSASPTIEDKDKEIVFERKDIVDLKKSPDLADSVGLELTRQFPDKQCFCLISNSPVSCRETARKNLQLKFGNEIIMDALPNPSRQYYRREIKKSTQDCILYQIVNYSLIKYPK